MEAQVLAFRRPTLVVFERFDSEDMAAMFRAKKGGDTYHFTLSIDGALEESCIHRDSEDIMVSDEEFTEEEHANVKRFTVEACRIYQEKLSEWDDLNPAERLAHLIGWGGEMLEQLKEAITEAAKDPQENSEVILLMCKDLETHEAYLTGLDTALALF